MSFIRVVFISLCLIAGTQASVAASLNEAMQECANIKRDLMRLACFDKLSGRVTDFEIEQLTEKQRQATRAEQSSQTEQIATTDNQYQNPESQFGLDEKTASEELDVISSYIPGEFRGWQKEDQFTLANGQIWEVVNGSLYHKATNPRIEISRGVFGSYRMKVVGLNKTAQVKRIQ